MAEENEIEKKPSPSRREFLKTSTIAAARLYDRSQVCAWG